MFIHHCSVFSFFLRRSVNLPRIRLDMKSLISSWGKLLNTTNAVACENSRFSSPEEKRMFSQASCKLSFPPSPLAHAFSWGSLLSVSLLASFIVRMPMSQVLLAYSYFEKGYRIKCTRQPRKVLWGVLSHFFSKKFERMAGKRERDWGERVRDLFPFPRFRAFLPPPYPLRLPRRLFEGMNAWRTPKNVCVGG